MEAENGRKLNIGPCLPGQGAFVGSAHKGGFSMRRLVSILLAVCLLCALGAAAAENESSEVSAASAVTAAPSCS